MRLRPTFLLAASSDLVDDDISRFSWPSLALLGLHSSAAVSACLFAKRPQTNDPGNVATPRLTGIDHPRRQYSRHTGVV